MKQILFFVLAISTFTSVVNAEDFKRPNVLFIAMDDLNDWIGCLGGHPQTITPNLDRLAASGVLFTNAHCPAPACNPCRSAVFTGRAPNLSGLYDNRQKMREVMPSDVILPAYFREHGYHASGSGKLLHYFIDAGSWDEYFPKAESENPFPQTFYPAERPVNLKRGGPWQYVETDWAALDVTDEEFGGDWSVSRWIGEQLSQEHDKPFFLGCGLYRPHEPWFVPKKYFEPFPLESIQLPPGYREDDLDDVPDPGQRAARNRYFAHIQDQGQWKRGIQGYLASIHFADAMLGRVLDALESGPNADNTIVVLWSDHGWQLGEKEHWQKYTPWRAVTRVPLMIRVPTSISSALPSGTIANSICDAPVNLLSLFPTLLELCDLPKKENNDGPSLLPLLVDPATENWQHNSVTFLSTPGSYAISGRTHRYIHYAGGSEELYDIQADPFEWTNLAAKPESLSRPSQDQLAAFRTGAPQTFASPIEPSVESLAKLTWHTASSESVPASKPDGNPFPVHFINRQRGAVQLHWSDRDGNAQPYGTIEPLQTKTQSTRPGAVWSITDSESKVTLGHFVIGDRTAQAVIPATKPNVIVILTDDQGWADLGCQGQVDDIRTPHIDALAGRGVRCTAAYVTSPQCSPSRAGLMTGRYQQRFGVDTIPDMPLATEAVTIAERLRPLSYRTGFVGKWHLEPNILCVDWMRRELPTMVDQPRGQRRIPWDKIQPYSPAAQGFDEYFWGELQNYRVNYELPRPGNPPEGQDKLTTESLLLPSMKVIRNDDFRIDVQTEAAVSFIDRNDETPFYLQLNYYGPHTPLEATEKYLQRFPDDMPTRRRYALAMIAAIDDGVGRIVERLKHHGLLDNTLIVMTSDNGAPLKLTKPDTPIDGDMGGWDGSLNEPWVGEKGMLSEGGIRVPMIWSLPSQLPSGTTYDWPVSTLDIAPSVLKLAGGDPTTVDNELDGLDLIPRVNDIQNPSTRTLYFRFWDQAAIRRGKWKYLFVGDGRRFLFDLESDQHEHRNLIEDHQELAGKLHQDLQTWCTELRPAGLPDGKKMRERNWYEFYFDAKPLGE
ncbi:sulfatase-like hydrolase/transferase [Neorhodopirellula pilleata]|nr:sulfatase-like hydrolase/transferase [Neorhodopirellula pilleata]